MSDSLADGIVLLDLANENVDLRRALFALLEAAHAHPMSWSGSLADAIASAVAILAKYAPDDPRAFALLAPPAHPASIEDDGDPE